MRVYLSSTLNDLGPEREAVRKALSGHFTVVESYIADERSVRESCLADVAGCDLYIGIIGRRYGFIPSGQPFSITELEYRQARKHKLPALIFIKDNDAILGPFYDAVTQENPPDLIESFRQLVNSGTEEAGRPVIFKTPEDLKEQVLKALLRYSQRKSNIPPKRIAGRPYPGLRAFLPAESDRFFGRDAEIEALAERLIARSECFLAVIGPSGSGKSSLIYAGLIPVLTESSIVGGIRWIPISFSPRELGDDPFQSLAAALSKSFPDQNWRVPDLTQRLRTHPTEIATVVSDALGSVGAAVQLLLFVDQFEEVFASKVDDAARSNFFKLLTAAVESPLVRVVIAMRSDFYNQWPQDEICIALLRSGHFPVAVPGPAALEKMITGPAQAAGLTISPRLVQRILDDTGSGPGALALVEFALSLLYDKKEKDSDVLTETAYTAMGGVAGAINGLAEQAVTQTEEALQQNAKVLVLDEEVISRLFLAIASVEQRDNETGGALAVVRRRAIKSDLPGAALILVQRLVDKRILVSREGSNGQPAVYEVGHEAVFSHWERFKDWYARYAADLALYRQAEQAARDWDRQQRLPVLKWGWERQRPAIAALARLNLMVVTASGSDFSDPMITLWHQLEKQLEQPLRQFLYPEPLILLEELNTDETPHQRREEIGLRLNQMGDPRRGVGLNGNGLPDIVWIDIPAGEVILETASRERFAVPPFRLARYPITWMQYRAFLDAEDGYCNPAWWEHDSLREEKSGQQLWSFTNYPVINVSWSDAVAYCRWLSEKLRLPIRLPTEWEWQWAAAGGAQQDYSWGDEWNGQRANSSEAGIGRTVAVGCYPLGRSPFGVDDMTGNVYQYCLSSYEQPGDVSLISSEPRVVRGGSWDHDLYFVRTSVRYFSPGGRSVSFGFRVLCSSPIE